MARCPACGHLPGVEDAVRADKLIQLAVDLAQKTAISGDSPEQVAVRVATLHGALMGLTFKGSGEDPPQ